MQIFYGYKDYNNTNRFYTSLYIIYAITYIYIQIDIIIGYGVLCNIVSQRFPTSTQRNEYNIIRNSFLLFQYTFPGLMLAQGRYSNFHVNSSAFSMSNSHITCTMVIIQVPRVTATRVSHNNGSSIKGQACSEIL